MRSWLHRWSRLTVLRVTPVIVLLALLAYVLEPHAGAWTLNDYIRWGWTGLTGLGALFALWNLREVLIDNWALSESPQRGVQVLKIQTHNAVYEHTLIFAVLVSDFLAGASSLIGWTTGALVSLLLSAVILIVLSFTQTQRRRRLFSVLRLRRPKGAP